MRNRTRSIFNRSAVIAALAALLASAVYVSPVRAAGIVVNTPVDVVNAGDGRCSLREAIQAANTNTASGPGAGECAAGSSGADTISFAGNYTITLAPALGQLPTVTSPVTVNGKGAANTVIRAHASPNTATMRVFQVAFGASLTLNALSVRNGRCNGACAAPSNSGGGGILNTGTLIVKNSLITGNTATGLGGGIYNLSGTLTVAASTISGNTSEGGGGGIYSGQTTTVRNSTFSGNTTPGLGAAIANSGTLSVTNSTFAGNSALLGGGISNAGSTAVTVTNSTFSGNSASSTGGAIFRSTATGTGAVTLKNTIVANSTAGGNCSGTITNGGNNLDSGAACGWGSGNGSLSNTDPKLGALANNGGPTQTMALVSGSPAIDTGTDAGCPATDQRGKPRPQGIHCDIGAYESPSLARIKSGGAQDGWVLESGENSNQGIQANATATRFVVGDNAANRQYRAVLHFDTSALPDDAVISRAILRIKKQGLTGTDPFTTHLKIAVDIRSGAFGVEALQPSDFQAAASRNAVGLIANNPQAGGWYFTGLNSTGLPHINRTGVTQLRLRFQTDDDNDLIADFLGFYSGNATPANRPVLVIEYYVP